MTHFFRTLPPEITLTIYQKLSLKDLFAITITGDKKQRVLAVRALFQRNSIAAIKYQQDLLAQWRHNPKNPIIPGEKEILHAITSFNEDDKLLGLSILAHRKITPHRTVTMGPVISVSDEHVHSVFLRLQNHNRDVSNQALPYFRKMIHLMNSGQQANALNEALVLQQNPDPYVQSEARRMIAVLVRYMSSEHLGPAVDWITDNLSQPSQAFRNNAQEVLRYMSNRITSTQWLPILSVALNNLITNTDSYGTNKILNALPKPTSLQLTQPILTWALDNLEHQNQEISTSAYSVLKTLAHKINVEQLGVILDPMLVILHRQNDVIPERMLEVIDILSVLMPTEQLRPVLNPILAHLKHMDSHQNSSEELSFFKNTHSFNLSLDILEKLANELDASQQATTLDLLWINCKSMKSLHIQKKILQVLRALAGQMTHQQKLLVLKPLLDDPQNQKYQDRQKAIQALPVLAPYMTDIDIQPALNWALDNLQNVHYEINTQVPMILSALSSRVAPEQFAPHLDHVLTNLHHHDFTTRRSARIVLKSLMNQMNHQQLAPALNWMLADLQHQDGELRYLAIRMLPILASKMTAEQITSSLKIIFDNLQSLDDEMSYQTIRRLCSLSGRMTNEQLIIILNSVAANLQHQDEQRSDEASHELVMLVDNLTDKQRPAVMNFVLTMLQSQNKKSYHIAAKLLIALACQTSTLELQDQLAPVINWATANLHQENDLVRRQAILTLSILSRHLLQADLGLALIQEQISTTLISKNTLINLLYLTSFNLPAWKKSIDILLQALNTPSTDPYMKREILEAISNWLISCLNDNYGSDNPLLSDFETQLSYLKQQFAELEQKEETSETLILGLTLDLCQNIQSVTGNTIVVNPGRLCAPGA